MRSWFIRGLLLTLLLASVDPVGLLRARAERGADIETTVRHLLARDGMTYRETKSNGVLKSMTFWLSACLEPLQVYPSPRTFDLIAVLNAVGAPGDIHRFAYLSRVSQNATRFSLFLEHMKHSALGLIAMTPYQPDGMMLMIDEPHGCKSIPHIDWSQVWRTDYRLQVERDIKQATAEPAPAKSRSQSN